jgi:hypothetical protein
MQIAFIARKHAQNIFKAFENRLTGVAAISFDLAIPLYRFRSTE